jgi:hypothetical protein
VRTTVRQPAPSPVIPKRPPRTSTGNIYIADIGNDRIRKVTNGVTSTVAGAELRLGDNGPATSGLLNVPSGVADIYWVVFTSPIFTTTASQRHQRSADRRRGTGSAVPGRGGVWDADTDFGAGHAGPGVYRGPGVPGVVCKLRRDLRD